MGLHAFQNGLHFRRSRICMSPFFKGHVYEYKLDRFQNTGSHIRTHTYPQVPSTPPPPPHTHTHPPRWPNLKQKQKQHQSIV